MSAIISKCGQFRYHLTRGWFGGTRANLGFIMLNPSTADAEADDPTIRKCIGFAKQLGYCGIVVNNLFAYRATDPRDLKKAGYPVGPENDAFIAHAAKSMSVETMICAWGANARHGDGPQRVAEVLVLLMRLGITPHALRLLDDGTPSHPLMLPYSCAPQPMSSDAAAQGRIRSEGDRMNTNQRAAIDRAREAAKGEQ
jgi:hypothetical protein